MEQKMIAALLEKYWRAETTVEEERLLSDYFGHADIVLPAEWEGYRELFGYYKAESQVRMGDIDLSFTQRPKAHAVQMRHSPWWAAAAVILISVGVITAPGDGPVVVRPAVNSSVAEIRDTYEDPEKALAAIRKALFKVSSKMEQGTDLTQKELVHFNQINHAIGN